METKIQQHDDCTTDVHETGRLKKEITNCCAGDLGVLRQTSSLLPIPLLIDVGVEIPPKH